MKHLATFSLLSSMVLSGLAISFAGPLNFQERRQQSVEAAAAEASSSDNTAYIYITRKPAWDTGSGYVPKYGLYSFDTTNPAFERIWPNNDCRITDGAFYLNGNIYYLKSDVIKAFLETYSSTFAAVDADDYSTVRSFSSETQGAFASDITYDYIGGKGYAVANEHYGSTNPNYTAQLKVIDLGTGTFTTLGSFGKRMYNIAADGDGQLWGVGQNLDTDRSMRLYKIDKNSAAATEVTELDTKFYAASRMPMSFDLRNGKLYIAGTSYTENESLERTYNYGIYEINTATGACTLTASFGEEMAISCFYFKDSHPKAPQKATNLDFTFDAGSISAGKISFTLPTKTYDGSTLTGTLTALISIDGMLTEVEGLAPGASYVSESETLAEGENHKIKVVCYSGTLESLPVSTEVFAGVDTPAAVTDIKVESVTPYDRATISWTAPQAGVSGGYIDTNKLTYTVTRKPDGKVVAESLADTSFIDELDREMNVTQYEVKAVVDGVQSQPAYSSVMLLGLPYGFPYLQTFDTNSQFLTYKVLDANQDANDVNGGTWYWDSVTRTAMYFTNGNRADDWLFAPTVAFDSNKVYRIQFQTTGYMAEGTNRIVVTVGNDCTVESQTQVILDEEYANTTSRLTMYTMFRPEEGANRVAFHEMGDGKDHVFLDNISITEYGTTAIPDRVTDIELSKTDEGKVKVEFNLPTKNMAGENLASLKNVIIYRVGVSAPLATIEGVTPGQHVEWIDETPVSGYNHYSIVAVNDEGPGMESDASISTYSDIPKAVTDIKITPKNSYTIAEVSWTQDLMGVNGLQLGQNEISYDIVRMIGVYKTTIAESVKGTTFVDRGLVEALGERQQQYVSYIVTPKTTGGTGESTTSEQALLGKSYSLPYSETFTDQQFNTFTWRSLNAEGGGFWGLSSTGYDPYTQGQDGYGLLTFSTSQIYPTGTADYISPRIDMSTFSDPTVTFYVFRSNDANTSKATLQAGVYTDETGVVMLSDVINIYGNESGWQQVTMAIPAEYATNDHLSLAFRGHTENCKGAVHLDNISVTGHSADYEVKAEQIIGPEQSIMGKENVYYVEVKNLGSNANTDIKVDLYADDTLVDSQNITSIEAGLSKQLSFIYVPSLDNTERSVNLKAVITAEKDNSAANNTVETVIDLVAPMLPLVNDLEGSAPDGFAHLKWSDNTVYPHVEYSFDDVESQPAFAIDNMQGWTTIDVDGAKTALTSLDGVSIVQWEHAGEPQAWIVMNAENLGSSQGNVFAARSGNQCFISFEATLADGAAIGGNDDWLISPLLSGDEQEISFYAKAFYPYLLEEQFEIWVSESTNESTDKFTRLTRPVKVDNASSWQKFSYTLPAGTRYFAIRCVSVHQYGLMIDDITFSPAHRNLEFWGYNVYRDGELITPDAIGDTEFHDEDAPLPADRNVRYNVTALFDEGESAFSNDVLLCGLSEVGSLGDDGIQIVPVKGGVKVLGAAGETIAVATDGGVLLQAVRATGNDLLPLRPGFYVVNAGGKTAKIIVK